jgi:membrane protein
VSESAIRHVQKARESGDLPPIGGRRIDPVPRSLPAPLGKVMTRNRFAVFAYRAFQRFSYAKATLLAAGTTYYVFLSIFAITALGFGLAAMFNADKLSSSISEALEKAFPGLGGTSGTVLKDQASVGQGLSVIGILLLLYSSSAAMYATSRSIHNIYGVPKDPRNYALARLRLVGWLLVLAPLALLSYVLSGSVTQFATEFFEWVGISGPVAQTTVLIGGFAVALALDFLIVYLLLGHFGGIMPKRRARLVGAGVGAIGVELLKFVMVSVVAWSLSQSKYGALTSTITGLLVIYLQCVTVYICAAITAALSEPEEPAEVAVAESAGGAGQSESSNESDV